MNSLFYGDNLQVLRDKIKDESVDLCYIDPPFNSKRNYNQIYNNVGGEDRALAQAFVDTWEWDEHAGQGWGELLSNAGGRFTSETVELMKGLYAVLKPGSLLAYLVSMTLRVNEIQRVLKPTGSFYLHCDPTASHYLKIVLDSIFVARGGDYRNEIIWKRTSSHNDAAQGLTRFGRTHDVLFYYAKSAAAKWNVEFGDYSDHYLKQHYSNIEAGTGRRYKTSDLTAAKGGGDTSYEWNGARPPQGRFWAYSKANMQKFEDAGLLAYGKTGMPRMKHYLDEAKGVSISDVWDDIPPINSQAAERMGYPTQKPEALLGRILRASSNENDVVLDAYAGCGTTVAVAQHLKRQWVGIDITYQSVALILKRLREQVGEDAWPQVEKDLSLNGIPRDMESAQALALKKDDRVRKEFEKWAVLTYSRNLAVINQKKGADAGIDGVAYFLTGKDENAKIVFQVKSGKVSRGDIAKLNSDRQREGAELACFLTLEEPTKPMRDEARAVGQYQNPLLPMPSDRIRIVTVREILDGQRLDLPMNIEVLKKAQIKVNSDQLALL